MYFLCMFIRRALRYHLKKHLITPRVIRQTNTSSERKLSVYYEYGCFFFKSGHVLCLEGLHVYHKNLVPCFACCHTVSSLFRIIN